MTDLQVKYHSLQETKRANEKQEALKAMEEQTRARQVATQERQASVAEREMSRKEGREKYERAKLLIDSATSFTQGMSNISSAAKNVAGTIGSVISIGTKVATSAAGLLG